MRILHVVPDVAMYSRHLTRPPNLTLFWWSNEIQLFYKRESFEKNINWKIHEEHLRRYLCINTALPNIWLTCGFKNFRWQCSGLHKKKRLVRTTLVFIQVDGGTENIRVIHFFKIKKQSILNLNEWDIFPVPLTQYIFVFFCKNWLFIWLIAFSS